MMLNIFKFFQNFIHHVWIQVIVIQDMRDASKTQMFTASSNANVIEDTKDLPVI